MAENKTKRSEASVDGYFDAIEDGVRRDDCRALAKLMGRVSKYPPKMWGTGIVGFGSYHYKYDSGREGDSCLIGFASRKGDMALYILGKFPGREKLLAELGRHKTAKACLYIRQLSDIDSKVLEKIIAGSIAVAKDRAGYQGHTKPKSHNAEKPESLKAEKPKSRKAEKPESRKPSSVAS